MGWNAGDDDRNLLNYKRYLHVFGLSAELNLVDDDFKSIHYIYRSLFKNMLKPSEVPLGSGIFPPPPQLILIFLNFEKEIYSIM